MFTTTSMELTEAYKVLGVSKGDSLKEIQTAYRRLVRNLHPDVSELEDAAEQTRRAIIAWETVSKLHVEAEKPQTETISVVIGDYDCKLTSERTEYLTKWMLRLPLAYCEHDGSSDVVRHAIREIVGFMYVSVEVYDAHSNTVFTSDSVWSLEDGYKRYLRDLRTKAQEAEFNAQRVRLDEIPVEKKPASHPVFGLIRDCQSAIRILNYGYGWNAEKDRQRLVDALHRLRREIDRLNDSDPVEVAIEQLMSGLAISASHAANLLTVTAINAASVRTGGFVEAYGEEEMKSFYREALQGFDNPLLHLDDEALRLNLDHFAPGDLLDDPDLEAAPLEVILESNKGQVAYDVTYRYDGDRPTAIIRLPLKVYERYAPEYGKPQALPTLPHDIVWVAEIIFDGKIIAHGVVDVELNTRLDKWRRGKNRAKHAEETRFGDLFYGLRPSDAPPWYAGDHKPGRRR